MIGYMDKWLFSSVVALFQASKWLENLEERREQQMKIIGLKKNTKHSSSYFDPEWTFLQIFIRNKFCSSWLQFSSDGGLAEENFEVWTWFVFSLRKF